MKKRPQASRFPDLSQTLSGRSGEERLGSHLYAVKDKMIFPPSISSLRSRDKWLSHSSPLKPTLSADSPESA